MSIITLEEFAEFEEHYPELAQCYDFTQSDEDEEYELV